MALLSFCGRALFIVVFAFSAYKEFIEFGTDGGPAAKHLEPKFKIFLKHIITQTGFQIPHIEMKHLVLGAIVLKAVGSFLFLLGSSIGASLLVLHQVITALVLYDFYNYDANKKEFAGLFAKFLENLALVGALLFFIGMKNSIPKRPSKKKAQKTKTV